MGHGINLRGLLKLSEKCDSENLAKLAEDLDFWILREGLFHAGVSNKHTDLTDPIEEITKIARFLDLLVVTLNGVVLYVD